MTRDSPVICRKQGGTCHSTEWPLNHFGEALIQWACRADAQAVNGGGLDAMNKDPCLGRKRALLSPLAPYLSERGTRERQLLDSGRFTHRTRAPFQSRFSQWPYTLAFYASKHSPGHPFNRCHWASSTACAIKISGVLNIKSHFSLHYIRLL